MLKRITLLLVSLTAAVCSAAESSFDPQLNMWTITNNWIQATFSLSSAGSFAAESVRDLRSGDVWSAAPGATSPLIQLQTDAEVYDAQRTYALVDQYTQSTKVRGIRQFIVLEDVQKTARFTVVF